jgi:hypothetical protein
MIRILISNCCYVLLIIVIYSTAVFSQENQFSQKALIVSPQQTHFGDNRKLPFLVDNSYLQQDETIQNTAGGKTKWYYVLFSLVIPGSGEWAMGYKGLGKTFFGIDAVLWLGYLGTRHYTNILQRDLEGYAALHAGVNTANKEGQYWIDVGSASSIYIFNEQKLRERDLEATYPEGNHYDWVWNSENNRVAYVEKRFDRLDWKRYTNWMIGALVLNRIVSAVDVVRLIRKEKSAENELRQSYLHMNYGYNRVDGEIVQLNLTMQF